MKLRRLATIAAFFRPDEAEETMKTTGVLLCRRFSPFMSWFGGWRRPEVGDRRRERESPARGERRSEVVLWCER